MRTAVRAGALSVARVRSTFVAPVGVYMLTVAGLSALVALVTAVEAGGGNPAALTVFLVTTALGFLPSRAASSTSSGPGSSRICRR